MFFRRLRTVLSVNCESCAWSCGALSRLFRCAEKPKSSLSSSREAELGCSRSETPVCDARPLQPSNGLLPRFVCCLGRLLNVQLCRGFVLTNRGSEVGGDCCVDDRGQASLQRLLVWQTTCDSILDHSWDTRFGCFQCPLVSNPRLTCAECGLRHPVLRETLEEPFERPVPNLVVHFCSQLFLKDLCGHALAGCG